MIQTIELGNFLSHLETKLEFDNGVTVFVGHNGAGKSSIIDAITFALFGKHVRKSNRGLIKRGSTQGFAKISITLNGKEYQAERKIDSKGNLAAQFSERKSGEWIQIAAGERKQFGESMTEQIEKTIGLNFEKLKIASIVQQGELNSIIKAKPKEFKELLNTIIGIDKLDIASEAMKTIGKEFRKNIRQRLGYDDTHIDILHRDLEKSKIEIEESKPLQQKLRLQRKKIDEELVNTRKEIEIESPKLDKVKQLEVRKLELTTYAKDAIQEIKQEIAEKERKIVDCEGCFEYVTQKDDLESKIKMSKDVIENAQKKSQELTNQKMSLRERLSLTAKLQLKDKKCPVCDSEVDKLNPLFQEEHLRDEIKKIDEQIILLEKECQLYNKKYMEFIEKLQKSRDAETTLRAHSIKTEEELKKLQQEIEIKKENIPLKTSTVNLVEISQIDSHSKIIFDTILKLEKETNGFNELDFIELKKSVEEKQDKVSKIDQQLGAIIEKINKAEVQIKKITNIILELKIVKKYVKELDLIQSNIFNRDGAVATSLRSWALNTISTKTSEYLALLNTKIQRIQLTEKSRDVSIVCHSKTETLDIESLSGGEQVSVALALRLGMASLLGASNLNLMILDEPTTHLDAERRKALVGVLSQLSDIAKSSNPMQFIIISHDSEIFEDSNVERIYKFESDEQGTKVEAI